MVKARTLPRWMHFKHGAFYYVRHGRWRFLSRDRRAAFSEYGRITSDAAEGAMSDLIDKALEDMKLSVAPSTAKNYTSCAARAKEAFAEFSPEQVEPIHIAKFLDDNKATPSMANLLRSFMKGVFQRAVRWGLVRANPVRDISQFATRSRDRYITVEEFKKIKANATPTLACLMDIAYITGQRIGDCLGMRYADISETGVFVKQQKTGARVLIAMTPDLEDVIARARKLHISVKGLTLFHRRDGTQIPYNTIYGHWQKACKAAKVENAHFHDIRAAAATDAKSAGLDSKTLLGHTTESSHNRYLRSKETKVAAPNKARKS